MRHPPAGNPAKLVGHSGIWLEKTLQRARAEGFTSSFTLVRGEAFARLRRTEGFRRDLERARGVELAVKRDLDRIRGPAR